MPISALKRKIFMNIWNKRISFGFSSLLFTLAALTFNNTNTGISKVNAQESNKFSCRKVNTAWTTVVNGKYEFIIWDSYFSKSGYTPEVRCKQVTSRLNSYFNEMDKMYLTHGKMNGLPVICMTRYQGSPCKKLVYTLKPNQDGELTMQNIMAMSRAKYPNLKPLYESPCNTYLNVNSVIEGKPTAKKVCN